LNPHSYRLKGRDFVHQGKIEIDVNERAVFIRTQGCFFVYTNSDCFLNSLEGGTAMLRKLNCFLNIVIGSFIGVFIGFGIYKFWHFKTYPNLYAMQSAPWYTELLLDGALVAVLVVVCIILKLIIWRKLKP
jgi:hypothetical protein